MKMVSKKEEDRRFQMELLKIEVDLENFIAVYIGLLALEFSAFWYYRDFGYLELSFLTGIIMLLTIFGINILYRWERGRRFRDLEKRFIGKEGKRKRKT